MRADVARSLRLEANRFDIEPQITARLLRAGHHVTELPVRFEARTRRRARRSAGATASRRSTCSWPSASDRARESRRCAGCIPGLALAVICAALPRLAVRFGSFVAGGSDSYCYVHQAERWASGRLLVARAAGARRAVARRAADVRAGRPRAVGDGAGRDRADLPARAVDADGAVRSRSGGPRAHVPRCSRCSARCWSWRPPARLALRATGVASGGGGRDGGEPDRSVSGDPADERRAGGRVLGAGAGAGHAAAAARGRCWPASAAALAILIRPNLVPLGFVHRRLPAAASRSRRGAQRLRDAAVYAVGCAAGCVAVAADAAALLRVAAGVGLRRLGDLFSIDARRAERVAVCCPGSCSRTTRSGAGAGGAVRAAARPFALAVPGVRARERSALYLPYLVFDDWSYVRFLLPAIPVLIVLCMGTLSRVAARAGGRAVPASLAVAALALVVLGVRDAPRAAACSVSRSSSRCSPRAGGVAGSGCRRTPSSSPAVSAAASGSTAAGPRSSGTRSIRRGSIGALAFARERGCEPYLPARQRGGGGVPAAIRRERARAARLAAADRDRAAGARVPARRSRALPGAASRSPPSTCDDADADAAVVFDHTRY